MHEGHRDRVRNRFLNEGLDNFDNHQVLELLLFYAIPQKDTNQLAHELIDRYGSLSAVFEADPRELQKLKGVGKNTAVLLSMIPQLCRRYLNDRWGTRPQLSSTRLAGEYVVTLFSGRLSEVFYAICLDSQNKVTYPALVHEGTIDTAPVYPREIVQAALRHHATGIILAHNHPGGSLNPSSADIEATKKIISACDTINVKVMDHIIVAGEKYFSFADNGLI